MALSVYNTLSRSLEEFHPLEDGTVRMYVCGPTVYGHSHLGHAKSYVSFDVIVRWLRVLGLPCAVCPEHHRRRPSHRRRGRGRGQARQAVARRTGCTRCRSPRCTRAATSRTWTAMNVIRPDICAARDRAHHRTDHACGEALALNLAYACERFGVLRRECLRRIRQTLAPRDRRADRGRARGCEYREAESGRFCRVEEGRGRAHHAVAQSVG